MFRVIICNTPIFLMMTVLTLLLPEGTAAATVHGPRGVVWIAPSVGQKVIVFQADEFRLREATLLPTQGTHCSGGLSDGQIDDYLRCKNPRSPLIGYGDVFMRAGEAYNVDPRLVVAIAAAESSFGTNGDCATRHHNAWGYGGGWPSCWNFGSWEEAINQVTMDIGRYYLPQGQNTIPSFVIRPAGTCTSHCWCASGCTHWVSIVRQIYAEQGGNPDTNDLTYRGNIGGSSTPAGHTFCAREDERCNFNGTADVAYGANGRFTFRSGVQNGVDCNNRIFGDPVPGVRKACYIKPTSTEPADCPGQYRAEYFANRSLSGSPVLVRCEGWPIAHDWSGGSPGSGVPDDGFTARWIGRARIEDGTYTFIARADDGIRVWIDNTLIIDAWQDQPPTEYRQVVAVGSGEYTVRVEYYENGGGALAEFRWERASSTASCQGQSLGLEQRVEGWLGNSTPSITYCLRASAGQVLSARMFALDNQLDPYLQIFDPDGGLLDENDDGLNIGYNSFLTVYIPQDGVYRIVATRYGDTAGRYALRVENGFQAAVGDLNRDCDVDNADRDRLRSLLGSTDSDADLDLDGVVSTRDALFQMRNLGIRCN